jgi:hypothetical protein
MRLSSIYRKHQIHYNELYRRCQARRLSLVWKKVAGQIRTLGYVEFLPELLARRPDAGILSNNPAELPLIESETVFQQSRPPLNSASDWFVVYQCLGSYLSDSDCPRTCDNASDNMSVCMNWVSLSGSRDSRTKKHARL